VRRIGSGGEREKSGALAERFGSAGQLAGWLAGYKQAGSLEKNWRSKVLIVQLVVVVVRKQRERERIVKGKMGLCVCEPCLWAHTHTHTTVSVSRQWTRLVCHRSREANPSQHSRASVCCLLFQLCVMGTQARVREREKDTQTKRWRLCSFCRVTL